MVCCCDFRSIFTLRFGYPNFTNTETRHEHDASITGALLNAGCRVQGDYKQHMTSEGKPYYYKVKSEDTAAGKIKIPTGCPPLPKLTTIS